MNEIKKTLLTIKVHWAETAFVIFLSGFAYSMALVLRILNNIESPVFLLFYRIFYSGLMIFALICFYGFLRSIHLETNGKLSIMHLIKIGKSFFWRMCGYGLLVVGVMVLGLITSFIARGSISIGVRFNLGLLVLMKPIILIPAVIITLDSKLIESFTLLKHYKLFKAKELIAVFLLMLCVNCFQHTLGSIAPHSQNIYLIFSIVLTIIGQFLFLVVCITAMRFVASQTLDDESERNSDLEKAEQNQ